MQAIQLNQVKKGDNLLGYLFIKSQTVKTSTNGSRYFNMTLSDSQFTGMNAKMWDVKPVDEDEFTEGQLVKVKAKVQEYNGNLQIIVNRMRLTNEGDPVDINDFVETTPVDVEQMYADLLATIDAFGNADLKKLVGAMVRDKKPELMYFPAAKRMHHALKGGLLFHTWSMLRLGKAITPLYPFIDAELLYAGIMLHDLGKSVEMLSDANGSVSDYSAEGKLLGHIITEVVAIDEYGKKLAIDPEIVLQLKHMVLAHHYEPEYGSPVRPMFAEAELLHHIDVIDARMNTMQRIQSETKAGGFSDKVWGLDGIQVYHRPDDAR
ncbi:3'-5' exoribonuclease YhaM family protein [Pseudoramibacter faecis]|uniref:3'-5' exoribonuclease YhaM family protein n=1 Tax=Pseudoramibacter faecis TaxID=3108534 RepID=UPI002E7892F1|nr:HD domain-containing protein [Pseudoramibacter sp. HA2172]